MTGDNRQDAFSHLLILASQQGYITIDNIITAADRWQLPIDDVDWLSNLITIRGILIYEEAPEITNTVKEDDEYSDYAQCDYDAVFDRVLELDPSLKPFVENVKQIRPPQFKELSRIIYQAKEGNVYARNRIVEMHLRFAVRIGLQRAEQYNVELADCIGAACIGLIMAVDKYDPDSSGPFGSYASLWMLQNISREQKTQRPSVYYPTHKKEQYYTMYPILREKGCLSCSKVWSCIEIRRIVQDKLGCSSEQTEDVILQALPLDSLDALLEDEFCENECSIKKHDDRFHRLAYERLTYQDDFVQMLERENFCNNVAEILGTLVKREEKVIRERFGFDDGKEKTLEEIGQDMNISRERVRQIEKKALHKLCRMPRIKKLKEYF